MRADGCFSELGSPMPLACPVRSGSSGECLGVLSTSLSGVLFCMACCTSAPMSIEPAPLTSMSLSIVMLRGVCVRILSNLGDAPADVSRCVPSFAVESRGFMCGDNGLLVSDETVVDLDGVVACLTGASTDCEARFRLAIAMSARCNMCLNWSRAFLADHRSPGSICSIFGRINKISLVVLSQRCWSRIFLCICDTAVDNLPI